MKEMLVDSLTNSVKGALDNLNSAIQVLSNGMTATYTAEANNIQTLIKPLAITLLSILFLIDLIDMSTRKGDELRWEDVARTLIKLLICKNLMEIAPTIMSAMYNSIATTIGTLLAGTVNDDLVDVLKATFEASIPDNASGVLESIMAAVKQVMAYVELLISCLIVNFVSIFIKVMSYGRMFELTVLESLSPIPIAFAGWGETKDVPKRFLMNYFGTCLQGLAMVACYKIFLAIIGSPASIGEFLMFTVCLLVGCFSSGKWAKDSLGLA